MTIIERKHILARLFARCPLAITPSTVRTVLVAAVLLMYAAATQAAPAFPVKYGADKRYLVDQNGVPFPIMGRTAWFVTSLPAADYRLFVDDTVARGFNAIEFSAHSDDSRGNHPPFNGNGDIPFLRRLNGTDWNGALSYGNITSEAPDFTTPNEAYWSFVDALLAYCESKGVLVFMFPAFVGYLGGNQGWMQEMTANGQSRMQTYGAWIATRYKNQKNLVWMVGGDMSSFTAAQNNAEMGLFNGLKSVPGQQSTLFSAEWSGESIATDQPTYGPSMTLNGVYTWKGLVNVYGLKAYGHTPVAPAFLLEEPYDEGGSGRQPCQRVRNAARAPLPVVGLALDDRRLHRGERVCLGVQQLPQLEEPPRYAGLARSRTAQRVHPVHPGGRPCALGHERHANPRQRKLRRRSEYLRGRRSHAQWHTARRVRSTGANGVDHGRHGRDERSFSALVRSQPTPPTRKSRLACQFRSRAFTPPGNNSAGQRDWVLVLDTGAPATPTNLRIGR